ncbi:alpha/beta hydrolase [Agromyces badenianii]|uniref:Alpha/beta hydrolase n=1 Tax=Agromyces badenianii TaxID=2080742 RepID=A0A2S0WSL1_9MICO|nr:alpha/beta hydrolase [Agromyces badenianii]AWB94333.1 alpha/beta hydrolase [Agromyces badenianii]
MDIILVPGMWLDASSWHDVVPVLEAAGHRAHPVTLPGMESREADRSKVALGDHVNAVVERIDAASAPVVLVGHSAGADLVWAAVDARPDRVARAILVGGIPSAAGAALVSGYDAVDGAIPLPEWSAFDDADLAGLDDAMRARFRERAIPSPAQVLAGPQRYTDERRRDVPVTAVSTEYSSDELRGWMVEYADAMREFTSIRDVTLVDLPTGHWPQFSRPVELAELILGQPPLAAGDSGAAASRR